ncbi:hypothetical protein [Paracidovorax konjaci]|uniref:hypothetical protein n=1 Tax=Paracidovorax konjaci TaxID=32040 RepID=UPI001113C8D7|nr:hypothetical protein [Paracidovorax konjaci]
MPFERSPSKRADTHADAHLGYLSNLSRSRPEHPGTGAASPQRQQTSALLLTRRGNAPEMRQAVTDVLKFVRETYYKPNLKSGNKVKAEGGPAEERRQMLATKEVERIRDEEDELAATMAGKAHQCGELTLLAMHHLKERGLEAQSLLLGGDEEDAVHEVAIIGPASNPLPADMTTWHPDVYVCDPWCNIACSAREYPKEFASKMVKWEKAGKLVGNPPEGFVLPTDKNWVDAVLEGRKML